MSATDTVPLAGSIANVTMTVFPSATPAAGTVTEIVVPLVSFAAVPTFLTGVIVARAPDGMSGTRSSGAAIAHRRRPQTNLAHV